MEIIKGNKLIAEFMDFKGVKCVRDESGRYYDYHAHPNFSCIKEEEIQIEGENGWGLVEQDFLFISDLKFRTSMDWLILVLKVIGERANFELVIKHSESYWNCFGDNPLEDETFGGYEDVANIWEAVVKFIEWWNESKTAAKEENENIKL